MGAQGLREKIKKIVHNLLGMILKLGFQDPQLKHKNYLRTELKILTRLINDFFK